MIYNISIAKKNKIIQKSALKSLHKGNLDLEDEKTCKKSLNFHKKLINNLLKLILTIADLKLKNYSKSRTELSPSKFLLSGKESSSKFTNISLSKDPKNSSILEPVGSKIRLKRGNIRYKIGFRDKK